MTATETAKIFMVVPMFGDIKEVDLAAEAGKPGLKEVLEMVRTGRCETFTMASGDRLVAGKGAFSGGLADAAASVIGKFAFLKEVPDFEKNPELMEGVTASTANLIEITGPALIIGPVNGDDKSATGTTLTKTNLALRVAWDKRTLKTMAVLSLLKGLKDAKGADNDNSQWDESVYDQDLVDHRMSLTDEELAACPCPGCKEELARRAVAAGGSAAAN